MENKKDSKEPKKIDFTLLGLTVVAFIGLIVMQIGTSDAVNGGLGLIIVCLIAGVLHKISKNKAAKNIEFEKPEGGN